MSAKYLDVARRAAILAASVAAVGMLPLAKAAETINADVAVVGGGSAGFAAALSAAELGSSVVLIEKEHALGGASTLGGVNNWEPVWGATGLPRRVYGRLSKIPGAAGVYEVGIHFGWQKADEVKFPGGIVRLNPSLSYGDSLRRHGPGLTDEAWFRRNCHGIVFEPKAMEETMAAMLGETGRCRVLLGTECTGVEHEGGRVSALRLSDGRMVRARIVVDACSAVCKMMGCEMMSGREAKSAYDEPGAPDSPSERMNGATLIYRVTPRTDGGEGLRALPEGVPEDCWWGRFPIAFCITYPNGDVGVNMLPTMSGDEALRMGAKSAYEECLRRVHAHWRWMQGRWPEFRKFRMGEIFPVLALRETSRVRGDYVLNQNDLIAGMSGQKHDDLIAFADHCMDSHGGGGPGGELREPYGIPYRCLLPRGTKNVLIAGRCASFSSIAASSCRLSRTMMQLGEAAGVAAHLAVSAGCDLRDVPVADIRAAMAKLDGYGEAATLYVECESFDSLGGWVVDPHSMKKLESSYVMAHGVGKPVADAMTTVEVPAARRYAVWAKTRDWSAEWREGRGSAPGRFKVVVNGAALDSELGAEGREWHWQKAGEVNLPKGAATLALHDLTGFNGRCDALFFTDDLSAKPPLARPAVAVADNPAEYDLAIVGGGVAGICMAQTAARYGVKTLLLQNRDVLGGCNSSEVRVGLGGYWHIDPYPNLGNVVDEIAPAYNNNRPLPPEFYEDARKAHFFVRSKSSCDVFYREHVFAIETDPADAKRIVAVLSRNTHTGKVTRHRAALFCDATGDAALARLAGCETMYGREARSRFNESCAPEKADRQVMGHSTQWTSRIADAPVAFPDIDWGFVLDESNAYHITGGGWEQEAGQYRDMADDTEAIRDYGLYAVFSNWSYLKNRSPRKAEWANREITWISPIGGKRESYRVVGDFVLTQNDIENHVRHSDLTAPITWNIDIHFPDPDNEAKFKEPFRSCAYHRCFNGPYAMPYRCLYARDAKNLFLAGRDISCSHVAFAATRVMGTLGVCGEVTGMAAAICKKHGCLPRDVYEEHLEELKAMMEKGVPRPGFYHSGGCGGELEYYHLKADDEDERPRMHPNPTPLTPSQERKIRALGVKHRHEHPQLAKKPVRRRLVLADESRGLLHYYDSNDSGAGFSIKMEKPLWDLTRIGEGRYRAVCNKGFMVADLKGRKVVDVFRHDSLDEVTSVCDLPDGGFLASVNPRGAKDHVILVRRFSKDRELVSTAAFRGIYYGRGLSRLENGDLLIGHETGFAVCRLPSDEAKDSDGEIVKNVAMPKGRNLFEVVPSRDGTGYWAGAGYGAQLLRFDLYGNLLSAWSADQGEKKNYFYAQVREQPNGHIYVANWTGHGANDSKRGWQVIEFDEKGNAVWHIDDPVRFGSIHGLDVVGTDHDLPSDEKLTD